MKGVPGTAMFKYDDLLSEDTGVITALEYYILMTILLFLVAMLI